MRELAPARPSTSFRAGAGTAATIVAAGLLGAMLVATRGDGPTEVVRAGCSAAVFGGLAMHDLATRTIPNRVVYPAAVLAMATAWGPGNPEPTGALLGGAIAFTVFAVLRMATRGIGGGDVKFAGLVGLVVGVAELPLALTVTALAGGVAALALLASGRATRGTAIPYGPFIALGGVAALLG